MASLLGLLIFILDIVAIADCIRSSKSAGHKVLWVILILVLPLVGLLLYYLLGKKA